MMRAITIMQPYGWLVAKGYKPVENRNRRVPWHIGVGQDVGIHIGKGWDTDALYDPQVEGALFHAFAPEQSRRAQKVAHWRRHLREVVLPALHELDGTVAAVAHLDGVHPWTDCIGWGPVEELCSEWAQPMQHHLELPTVRPLATPVPCRGYQGLWSLPHDVEAQVRAGVAA